MKRTWNGTDVLAVVGLTLTAVVWWKWRILDPATKPPTILSPSTDVYTQIYPMVLRAGEWLRAGTIPLWNPFQYCGHPFLATGIYGVLYPFNVPYLLFPTALALEIVAVSHLAAAGVFTYAFARALQLERAAAAVSGFVFMLSGYVVLQSLWFPPAMCAAAWLPLSLLAIENVVRTRRALWAMVFGSSLALAFLAGWPQIWLYSVYVVAAYTAVRLAVALASPTERSHLVRVVALLAFGTMIACGLMMGQLLPGLELQAQGPRRAGGLSLEQMLVFGGPVSGSWVVEKMMDSAPGEPRIAYVGIFAFLLLPASIFLRPWRAWVGCFWVLMLFSLAVAASASSVAFDVYRSLPGGGWFRAPIRFLYVHAFAAALLSGAGFSGLVTAHDRLGTRIRLGMTCVIGAGLVAVWNTTNVSALSGTYLILGVALTVGIVWLPRCRWRDVACAAFLVVMWWSLFTATRNDALHPYQDLTALNSEHRLLDYIKTRQGLDRTYVHSRLEVASMMAKQGTLREIYMITDYEPLSLLRYDQFYRLLEAPADHRNPLHTFTGQLYADPALPTFDALLDLMSVRFVVAPKLDVSFRSAMQARTSKWRAIASNRLSDSWVLFENTSVLPRAYVAYDVRHAADSDAALAAVSAPEFDPRSSVIVEGATQLPSANGRPKARGRADIVHYAPAKISLDAQAEAPGYLVLNDTFYPGWRATVDGVEVPIVQANFLFRAVPLGPGRHHVAFEYSPRSFRFGITITAGTLAIVVLVLIGAAWQVRRRSASPTHSPA